MGLQRARRGSPTSTSSFCTHKQVSFASAPAGPLASQPFRNREQQHVAAHRPGRLYEVQLQANTTAPYGDQFDVLLRLRLLDDPTSSSSSSSFSGGSSSGGSASSLLHVAMAVRWRPTMMPLMKAVIAGAIEGAAWSWPPHCPQSFARSVAAAAALVVRT